MIRTSYNLASTCHFIENHYGFVLMDFNIKNYPGIIIQEKKMILSTMAINRLFPRLDISSLHFN